MSICLMDGHQNTAVPRAMSIHDVEKVWLQLCSMLITRIMVHLKTLSTSVLSLIGGIESEWKCCSSPLSVEKTLGVYLSMNPALRLILCSFTFLQAFWLALYMIHSSLWPIRRYFSLDSMLNAIKAHCEIKLEVV